MQHLCHGRACDVGTFFGQAGVGKIAAGMFRIGKVDIRDDINNAAVGFLWQAFVLAAIAGLHVEDGDVQTLGANHTQARVRVAQHKNCIGLHLHHELVALGNDIAHCFAKVIAHSLHVDIGVGKLQVLEEYTIEIVVIILTCMCQKAVEIFATLVDDGGQAYDFGPRAHDNQQLQLSVVLELLHIKVCSNN